MKIGFLWRFLPAILFAAGTVVATAGPAQATEIAFGSLTPTGSCTVATNSSNGNEVCANGLMFTSGGNTYTATGYSNAFTTATALTLKPEATNGLTESGLGENASFTAGGPNACTDTSQAANCEIAGTAAVALVSSGPLIDALVGSVQGGENFQLWTGSSIATLTKFGGVITGECSGSALCTIDFPAAEVIGVQSGGTGNVLLTAVSVPEPSALWLLGTALLGFGLVYRRRSIRRG